MNYNERLSGNEAIAFAMKQIDPDVMAAFPITPSTEIPQYFAQYVANGEVNTEFVPVESEHSSMSACIGAEAAGARAITATSSAGLALMYEMMYVAASCRLPITLACVNRALSGPININNDHSDSMFVGEYHPEHYLLKEENPLAVGPYDLGCHYMEHKVQQAEAMKHAKARILEVAKQFEALTGRKYGLFEEYQMEDAEVAVLLIGSSAGTAKAAVDQLRKAGVKAGLIKIRVFRPFPAEELAQALAHVKVLAILDKAESFSANGGPLFSEVRGALYDLEHRPRTVGYVYGLGGRDITPEHFKDIYARLTDIANGGELGPVYTHLGQRG